MICRLSHAHLITTALTALLPQLVLGVQPHIVFIVADDYGWNDVGYHGSEIETPNLDSLAAAGIKLENYYVQPLCSPSRSAIMSGKYPIHTGLQHDTITPCQRNGLPLSNPTVAEKLKDAGYVNHMIGKWHIGFYQDEYTPTSRGFHSFQGYFTAKEDYYTRYRGDTVMGGIDYHENKTGANETYGQYSATLFATKAGEIIYKHDKQKPLFLYLAFQSVHEPLMVPKYYEDRYTFIKNDSRRVFAGMVSAMDEAVGNVTMALKGSGLWDNTILIFTTDNGGPVNYGANNAPLRGSKGGVWEGGVRGVSFVSGHSLKNVGQVNGELIHISDWFPTLVRLAGGSMNGTSPDGFDQWDTINLGHPSPRREILHNIDPFHPTKGKSISDVFDTSVQAALRYGDWKILTGDPGLDAWVPEPRLHPDFSPHMEFSISKTDDQNVFLFNITADPNERTDLSMQRPDVVSALLERLAYYNSTAVPAVYPPEDKACDPKYHGGFWSPWM